MTQSDLTSPFHSGEQTVQSRVGVRDRAESNGRKGIRTYMPEQHRQFFGQLPFIVLGALDDAGQPWASMLPGLPGFVHAPDEHSLQIDAVPDSSDPLAGALRIGCDVGLLGIELETRRRNRLNGPVLHMDRDGMRIGVAQSFGNCPKYIQARSLERLQQPLLRQAVVSAPDLDDAAMARIRTADTFFIATHAAAAGSERSGGADVSHRGGKPGFIRVDAPDTLLWPDFAGNSYFNTLGNLQVNPRAGLLFPDFISGDLLYLAGRCEVIWEGDEVEAFAGAERLVRFHIECVHRRPQCLPWRFSTPALSPFLAGTGDWPSPSI